MPDAPARHFLPPAMEARAITILLVGCGGNGAQMLMGLAMLDTALRAISSRSLQVTVADDDIVTEANLGRQPFYPCDLGNSKARTLTERINIAHGLDWHAIHGRAPDATGVNFDIVITAVDTASARRAIGAAIAEDDAPPRYWLDLGNRATDGQFILGYTGRNERKPAGPRLLTVLEHFPELADESVPDDDAPSCSVAEALERQSLFVNRVIASHALALLFDLLGRGSIGHAGGFVNLATGQAQPIPLPRPAPEPQPDPEADR